MTAAPSTTRAPRCRHSARHCAAPHIHSPTHVYFPQCRCLPPHPAACSAWHFGPGGNFGPGSFGVLKAFRSVRHLRSGRHFGLGSFGVRQAYGSGGILARTPPFHSHASLSPATTTARMTALTTMEGHSQRRHSTRLGRELRAGMRLGPRASLPARPQFTPAPTSAPPQRRPEWQLAQPWKGIHNEGIPHRL